MLLECHKQQPHILVVATHAHLMRDLVKQLHVNRTPLTEFGQANLEGWIFLLELAVGLSQ